MKIVHLTLFSTIFQGFLRLFLSNFCKWNDNTLTDDKLYYHQLIFLTKLTPLICSLSYYIIYRHIFLKICFNSLLGMYEYIINIYAMLMYYL